MGNTAAPRRCRASRNAFSRAGIQIGRGKTSRNADREWVARCLGGLTDTVGHVVAGVTGAVGGLN